MNYLNHVARKMVFPAFLALFGSLCFYAGGQIPQGLQSWQPLHHQPAQSCIYLVIYFDIDNTANSYFNNISYFLNDIDQHFPASAKGVNLVMAEDVFDSDSARKEFLSSFSIDQEKWQINLIESDSLLFSFEQYKGLPKYLFLKNGNPIASGVCKWHKLHEQVDLLRCIDDNLSLRVNLLDKTNIKKKVVTTNNVIEVVDANKVLLLNDFHNKLMLLDYRDGGLNYKEWSWQGYVQPIDLFCQYFAQNELACKFAREHEHRIKKMAKQPAYFASAFSSDSAIYVALNFFAFIQNPEDFIFINDIGETDTLPEGEMVGNQYSVILEFDHDLRYKYAYPVVDTGIYNGKGNRMLAGVDYGFMIDGSRLFSFVIPGANSFNDSDLDYSIANLERSGDGTYTFRNFEKVPFPSDFSRTQLLTAFVKPVQIGDNIAAAFGGYDWFFLGEARVSVDIAIDTTALPEETFESYLESSDPLWYNFHILGISAWPKGNFISIFLRAGKEFYLVVLDEARKAVATLLLNNHPNFPPGHLLYDLDEGSFALKGNMLVFNYREKGAIQLVRYEILIEGFY